MLKSKIWWMLSKDYSRMAMQADLSDYGAVLVRKIYLFLNVLYSKCFTWILLIFNFRHVEFMIFELHIPMSIDPVYF